MNKYKVNNRLKGIWRARIPNHAVFYVSAIAGTKRRRTRPNDQVTLSISPNCLSKRWKMNSCTWSAPTPTNGSTARSPPPNGRSNKARKPTSISWSRRRNEWKDKYKISILISIGITNSTPRSWKNWRNFRYTWINNLGIRPTRDLFIFPPFHDLAKTFR